MTLELSRFQRLGLTITCLASLLTFGLAGATRPSVASADVAAEPVVNEPAAEPAPLSEEELAASLGMHNVLDLQTLNLINLDRLSRGLRPLEWDPQLADVARAHATDMMTSGKVSHTGSDGSVPLERMRRGGVRFTWGGENIWTYRGRVPHLGPPTMHGAMMEEPHEPGLWNHIANILMPHYKRVGIGIVISPNGTQYLAENFTD